MFSTYFKKICCIFAENKIFEKSKMAANISGGHVVIRLLPWQQFLN